jgi:predicted nucleic acid-binding protein
MVMPQVFLDTSVLVAGLLEIGPAWKPAQQILQAAAQGRANPRKTAWHCCLEFYAVATRMPEDFRLSPAQALRLVEEAILPHLRIVDLPEKARIAFLRGAAHDQVAGGRLYDAHIAEIARLSGVGIVVTDNRRHFTTLLRHGVRVLTAVEFAAET